MHELLQLPYSYDALEPYIDARTMEIHYTKHHAAYVGKLNEALQSYPDLQSMPVEDLLLGIQNVPEQIRTMVINNGGGYANHTLFWKIMKPQGGGEPGRRIGEAIQSAFGGFQNFRDIFSKAAVGQFGSGWAWLIKDQSGKLSVIALPNQDSPLMQGFTPVLGLDVWEHAYYLKYQNRRVDYVEAWWNVVNWEEVEKNLAS